MLILKPALHVRDLNAGQSYEFRQQLARGLLADGFQSFVLVDFPRPGLKDPFFFAFDFLLEDDCLR